MQNFRADAPMGEFGKAPWGGQLGAPYNTVLDCWGVPGGLVRGLFEYDYRADSLRVRPHLPSGITRYVQKKAVVFGPGKIYLTVTGTGKVVSATANGNSCRIDAAGWIELKNPVKDTAVEIACGNAKVQGAWKPGKKAPLVFPNDPAFLEIPDSLQSDYHVDLKTLKVFYQKMARAGLDETYEGAMGRTALELMLARYDRQQMRKAGTLPIPEIKPVPALQSRGRRGSLCHQCPEYRGWANRYAGGSHDLGKCQTQSHSRDHRPRSEIIPAAAHLVRSGFDDDSPQPAQDQSRGRPGRLGPTAG